MFNDAETPGRRPGAGSPTAPPTMDDDVAAILGLTPKELKRGVAALGWIAGVRRSTWALAATAVVAPALVAAVVAYRERPDAPQGGEPRAPIIVASLAPPRAMQAEAPPPKRVLATEAPKVLASAAPHETTNAILPPPRSGAAITSPDRLGTAEATRTDAAADGAHALTALETAQGARSGDTDAEADATAETSLPRRQIVQARLEAVDALRALRQK